MKTQRKQTIKQLEQVLRNRRANAHSALNSNLEMQPNRSVMSDDVSGEAQLNEQMEMSSQLAAIESAQLARINEALERIESGKYGTCDDCGSEISLARLTALPYATRCLQCQAEADKHQTSFSNKSYAFAGSDDE